MSCIWTLKSVAVDVPNGKYRINYRCGCTKDEITYNLKLNSSMTRIKNYDGLLHVNGRLAYCPYCDNPVEAEQVLYNLDDDDFEQKEQEIEQRR